MQPNHQSNKSQRPAGSSKNARNKSANHPTHRGTAVPRFGTWDEKDPTSGDGFTVIFNKVKEEKRNASANFLTPPQQNKHSDTKHKHGTSCSRCKICCCIL